MKGSTIKGLCFLGGMFFTAGLVMSEVERLKEDCSECGIQMGPNGPVAHLHCGHKIQLNPASSYRIGAQHLTHDCSKHDVSELNIDEEIQGLQNFMNPGF